MAVPDLPLRLSPEVEGARASGAPVVALESTVFSRLGLPAPANRDAASRCLEAVAAAGAVPALTAVVDGWARVGLAERELDLVLGADRKVAARDLPVAVAERWPVGVTTVSASLALAAAAGIAVFATGGIGGVHRDVLTTGDVSGDVAAIARHPVTTVCAGAKAFLDVPRTLELLEALEVPVLAYATDEFPAFWSRRSGLPAPRRADTATQVAAVVLAARSLGWRGGVLLAVPVPEEDALAAEEVEEHVGQALRAARDAGVAGGGVTPFVLAHLAEATGGRTVRANVALAEANAGVAAAVACELARA